MDYINQLPIDNSIATPQENQILETYFKNNETNIKTVFWELKDAILGALIFIILSLPFTDNTFNTFLSITKNSQIFLTLCKAIAFVVLYYLSSHYLLKKIKS